MNKKLWLVIGLLMALFVLAGCGQPASITLDLGGGSQQAVVAPPAGAVPAEQPATDAVCPQGFTCTPNQPAPTCPAGMTCTANTEQGSQAGVQSGAGEQPTSGGDMGLPCNTDSFKSYLRDYVGNLGPVIGTLDAQASVSQVTSQMVPATIDGTNGCVVFWTGAYFGDALPEGMTPVITDGQTGIFLIRGRVEVKSVGAYMNLDNFSPSVAVNQEDDMPEPGGCMPVQTMYDALNTMGRSNPEGFFLWLDNQFNAVGAPYLSGRYRPEPLEAKTYEGLVSGQNMFWTQAGKVGGVRAAEGATDPDYVVAVESGGKWAVVNLKTSLILLHVEGHTGGCTDAGMDLAGNVTWWGK